VKLSGGGSKLPLFLMHSHGGNILEYQPLASRLGETRPVYALQALGLDGNLLDTYRIEDMARSYLKEIRAVQPHGPYRLGGYCMGGMFALEAAQQLRAEDEEVDLIVMMNTSTKHYPTYPARSTGTRRAYYRFASRVALELDNLWQKRPGTMLAHALARGRRVKDVFQARVEMLIETVSRARSGRTHSMVYELERLAMFIDNAGLVYHPRPYDGKVLLLRAARQPLGIVPDKKLGWEGLLTGEVHVQEVPGFRQNMLAEPNAEILASVVHDALEACESVECQPQLQT